MNTTQPIYEHNLHGNEFRLRLLSTDQCNRACSFCLNDFQPKPGDAGGKFLDVGVAKTYIYAYQQACGVLGLSHPPLINISGGEPGLHPELHRIVESACKARSVCVLNTNGTAILHPYADIIESGITCLRMHVFPGENYPFAVDTEDVDVQAVYDGKAVGDAEGDELIAYYGSRGIPIKFFVDFHGDAQLSRQYESFIHRMRLKYPDYVIKARFTGVQQNRGPGCFGCDRKCITLKALWVYPDGSCSVCPQGLRPRREFDPTNIYSYVLAAHSYHATGNWYAKGYSWF